MSKYNKLAQKHVLVIGGSNGIGRGVVEASVEAGARVTLIGSSQKSADAAVSAVKATYPSADVTGRGYDLSKDTVEEDLEKLFNEVGPVNHVVLTAADKLAIKDLQEITPDLMHHASHMRLVLPLLVGKTAARHLPRDRESSYTLTTGSIADSARPGWSLIAFLATGLTGLARNLALEMKPVRVNAVEPGFVNTGLWDGSMSEEEKRKMLKDLGDKFPTGSAGRVEDVAEAYLYAMRDWNCTGEVLKTRSGAHLI